jgi:hypothetical protein
LQDVDTINFSIYILHFVELFCLRLSEILLNIQDPQILEKFLIIRSVHQN